MKSYRCVFSYAGGHTTIAIEAETANHAADAAVTAINAGDFDRVEVWNGDNLVLTRTTPRPWDTLGDGASDAVGETTGSTPGPEQPQTAPLTASLPRRTTTLFSSGLRALGFGAKKLRWPKRSTGGR